jgi:PAS domain S-box-containing protein
METSSHDLPAGVSALGDWLKPTTRNPPFIPMNDQDLVPLDSGVSPPEAPPSESAPMPPPDVTANILLVDDRADKMLALDAILESLGQNVVQARSGKEALRQLLKQDFAVILLDVSMPGMDGFETAALIRQRPCSQHTPIIFITSIGISENQISRGYSIGAVDYILSPIVPEVLCTKVSVFVELYKKTELIKRQAECLRRAEETKHQGELAEFTDRLEAETRRNRFFTLAPEMLGIAGLDDHLLQVNSSWEKVLGYAEAEWKGSSNPALVHPEDRARLLAGMEALKTGLSLTDFEGRFRHKDGSYRWLAGTAVPFLADKMVYIFARDITPRKQAEEQISRLNHELELRVVALTEANRELEAFNYSIAHDLRAPLRSMSGFAHALLEDEPDKMSEQALDYASRIARSAKYMDNLLRDLLAYSQLAREKLLPAAVTLEEPINELLAVLEPEIRERRVQIEVVSPLGTAFAHLPTLKQILGNLIGNSLKFLCPDRASKLRIHSTTEHGAVRLWIEDNGIGIAPENHEKIFGLFRRLHDAQAYPGTGIGLALVRKGAERMGGRAGVESQLGQGSRFWVEFPAAPDEN